MAFPKIDACIVCEGVRQEVFNKNTLLGFFGMAPHAQVSLKDVQLPATLCLVFCGGEGEGTFNVGLQVKDSEGGLIANSVPDIVGGNLAGGKAGTSIFMGFQGVFGRAGKYQLTLTVNGQVVYSTTLGIQQTPPATVAAAAQ